MELLPVEPVRDLEKLRLPRWGRVREVDGIVAWELVDDAGCSVEPVRRFLHELMAQKRSRGTLRSYAYVLQRWWRFLIAVEVPWDKASPPICVTSSCGCYMRRSRPRGGVRCRRRRLARSTRSPVSRTRATAMARRLADAQLEPAARQVVERGRLLRQLRWWTGQPLHRRDRHRGQAHRRALMLTRWSRPGHRG